MILFTFMGRILGLISTVILARLLTPADFGLVAMAMSVVFALELLNSFGFEFALVQRKDAGESFYNTAWTLRLMFAMLVATLLVVLAGPASEFYEQPNLRAIIYCLAFSVAVEGFQNIGVVGFLKELEFQKEFIWRILVKLAMFVTTVPLAIYLGNYWALVAGMIIGRISGVALSYVMHPFRPSFSLAETRRLLGFSIWLSLNSMIAFFRLRSADFVLGRTAGPAQLGLFSVANELAGLVTTDLVLPINRAVFPGFAKVSDDLARLRSEYLNVIGLTCIFTFPAGLGIAATADLLIPTMLGAKWLDAVPLIKILALQALYASFYIHNASVYISLGRPKVGTMLGMLHISILLPLLIMWTSESGATGAAFAYLTTVCIIAPVGISVTLIILHLNFFTFLSRFWRPLVAAAAMYWIVARVVGQLGMGQSFGESLANLLISIGTGVLCYVTVVAVLWQLSSRPPGAEHEILNVLVRRTRSPDST